MSPTATPTTPTRPTGTAPTGTAASRASVAVAFVAVVVLASGVLAQLVGPFIRRDDWPFLLPAGTPGAADPIAKVEEEGRWVGYAWWFLVGQHGTPTTAVVVFFAVPPLRRGSVAAVPGHRAGHRGPPRRGPPRVTALGPAHLLAGLARPASAVVAAVGVWTLPWAARRRRGLAVWVVLVGVLAVLTYPPVGGLLLIAAAVHLRDRPWKDVLFLVGGFLVGDRHRRRRRLPGEPRRLRALRPRDRRVAQPQRAQEPGRPAGQQPALRGAAPRHREDPRRGRRRRARVGGPRAPRSSGPDRSGPRSSSRWPSSPAWSAPRPW